MSSLRGKLSTSVALTALASLQVAFAQDEQGAGGGNPLDTVVVTAQRVESNLQQTPVAITAFSGDALEDKNVTNLLDVAAFVPSLSIGSRSASSSAGGAIAIRGMGVDAIDSSAAVGTYIDDVYFASSLGNLLGLLDVERVEVLRGPQGTLFGRNTIAGAIQYVTRSPEGEFGGFLKARRGTYGRKDIQGAINIPLADAFAVRVSGMWGDRDGYVKDLYTGQDRGAEETYAARLRARWEPTDRLTVDFKGEILSLETNGRATLTGAVEPNALFYAFAQMTGAPGVLDNSFVSVGRDPSEYENAGFNAPDFFDFEYNVLQGSITYDITDSMRIKSITARAEADSVFARDSDGTPLSILSTIEPDTQTNVFTQELQLTGEAFAEALSYTLGLHYFDSEFRQTPGQLDSIGLAPASSAAGSPARDEQSIAAYVQGTYRLSSYLAATLGVRYSDEKVDAWLQGVTAPEQVGFTDWSPHIGLEFTPKEDVLIYAKASKGFRAGGFTPGQVLIANGFPSGNRPFAEEIAWTYELGARLELFDGRLRFNPTIFQTDWDNIQFIRLEVFGAQPHPVTDNAGDARIRGFELETQFAPTDNLVLSGALSVLDAKYRSVEPIFDTTFPGGLANPPVFVPAITLDSPLQLTPEVSFTVGAHYTVPVSVDGELDPTPLNAATNKETNGCIQGDRECLESDIAQKKSYRSCEKLRFISPKASVSARLFAGWALRRSPITGGAVNMAA